MWMITSARRTRKNRRNVASHIEKEDINEVNNENETDEERNRARSFLLANHFRILLHRNENLVIWRVDTSTAQNNNLNFILFQFFVVAVVRCLGESVIKLCWWSQFKDSNKSVGTFFTFDTFSARLGALAAFNFFELFIFSMENRKTKSTKSQQQMTSITTDKG